MGLNNEITSVPDSEIIPSQGNNNKQHELITVKSHSNLTNESTVPSFKKLLVTYDGTEKSDKAINYSIYLSSITKAEIVILQVLENIDKLENSSIDISNKIEKESESEVEKTTNSKLANDFITGNSNYSVNVEGSIIESMENKIREIENSGFKNKLSYKIRAGFIVDEIVKETHESNYDLLIISSSHMDSWIKSIFSESRKIISKVELPVLLLH